MGIGNAVVIDAEAERLIERYTLRDLLERIEQILFAQRATPERVARIVLSPDRAWSQSRPRLLMTVEFDADSHQAYDAWKRVCPLVEPISSHAEDEESLIFDFAGRDG